MNDLAPTLGAPNRLTIAQRYLILIAAFTAWMFAGLENSLFILIHRQMMLSLLDPAIGETIVQRWFAWFQAAALFGAAAGGWLFGTLGDRWGRTRSMGLGVLCYSLLTLACYFVGDARLMLVTRFLACMGMGGVWPNAVALVAEAWPDASRPFLAGLLGTAANVGFVLLGIICYYVGVTIESWRWVLLVGAAPALIGVLILFLVPESVRWITARRAVKSASDQPSFSPLAEVLRPPLLRTTLIGIALGAVPVIGAAANANWIVPWTDRVNAEQPVNARTKAELQQIKDERSRKKAVTQMVRSGGGILGSLFGGIIASLVGRRLTFFLISIGAFVTSTYVFTQLTPVHPQFYFFTFFFGFIGVAYFGWLPLFLPELFPTRVRSTGSGISFNTGHIVAAVVVLSVGFLVVGAKGDTYASIGFWSGMIYIVGMFIIWFVPAAEERHLED